MTAEAFLKALFSTAPGWVAIIIFLIYTIHSLFMKFIPTPSDKTLRETIRVIQNQILGELNKFSKDIRELTSRIDKYFLEKEG